MFRRDRAPEPAPAAAPAPAPAAEAAGAAADPAASVVAETPAAPAGPGLLGTTVASLGNPADAGLWISTPLVTSTRAGRIVYPVNGASAEVELRPSGAADGAGSQVSLQALQALRAPITGLPELEVYAL